MDTYTFFVVAGLLTLTWGGIFTGCWFLWWQREAFTHAYYAERQAALRRQVDDLLDRLMARDFSDYQQWKPSVDTDAEPLEELLEEDGEDALTVEDAAEVRRLAALHSHNGGRYA